MKPYGNGELDPIIPISLELDDPCEDEIVACMTEQHEKYGFCRFTSSKHSVSSRSKQ